MLSFCVASVSGDLAFLIVFLSACILIAAGMIVKCSGNFPESGSIFSFIGYLVYLGTLFVLSFYHRGKGMFTVDFDNVLESVYFFSFSAVAIGLFVWLLWLYFKSPKNVPTNLNINFYGVLITLCVAVLNTVGVIGLKGWAGAAVFNMIYLFHSIALIVTGCRSLNVKLTTIGCLLFAFISIARYTDLFVSLLARSSVFLIMGAALFSAGFYYSRNKKQLQEKAFEFDFSDPRWWVKTETAQPIEIGTLDWNEQFRMIYRPPNQAATAHLKDRDIIWHGYLPSRAFHGRGRID